jgi:hypothetical protein
MPFRTPPGAARDLLALIETELRERLEEAVDHACLNAMVSARRAAGESGPVADDARDREEFTASVRALLERLRDEIPADANEAVHAPSHPDAREAEEWRLLAIQVTRARALPDYWTRFEAVRVAFTADYPRLRRARRGVLGRLFGRG